VAQSAVFARALDQARHVANREPLPVGVFDDSDLRMQRGERIRRDFRARAGNGREQRGLASVRIADEADFSDDAQLKQKIAFVAWFARLRESRRLARSGGEIAIAQSAASAFAQDKLLSVRGEVGDQFALLQIAGGSFHRVFLAQINFLRLHAACAADEWTLARTGFENWLFVFVLILISGLCCFDGRRGVREPPNERAAGNLDDEIFSSVTVHALAQAMPAARCNEARHIILLDEIVQVVVGLEDDAAAAPPVAAARAALGDVSFTMERDGTLAAVPRLRVNFYFVNEHDSVAPTKKGEAEAPP